MEPETCDPPSRMELLTIPDRALPYCGSMLPRRKSTPLTAKELMSIAFEPKIELLIGTPSIIDSVEPPRLPRTRIGADVLRCSSATEIRLVFCGTSWKPCCSANTPAMDVTGSDWICSSVIELPEPTCPRSISGVFSACTVTAARVWFVARSLKFCSRVTSMAIRTSVVLMLWKPSRRACTV